ncbi:TMV resistance protein N-like isoform X2 [Cynara cardunculus var. scolymus]|uniref:TMV resistance protein N-like isoform X2 n=1 Tax=Cynara cardunculus var. scolymus TaxID=59895 RepID=UPI000D62F5BA|nr:TMV resistance protein N-like isoform X2 [Cynara cardunculus var. scolymus]
MGSISILRKIGSIACHCRGESIFINKIVQEISGYVQPCRMENNLIGIESRINELNSLLGTEATHEVRMVGICGMGGIGKTTIARALFRRISYEYDGSSFVKGVRENSKKGICSLQQQILKDVLATHHESLIEDPEDGAELIQTRFCNKKVLLVLDDVDDVKQLWFLAATHEWFGAGSRIIITTRNEHLLSDTNAKYKPALLNKEHAVELFSRHAFGRNSPLEGYEELSNRVIRYTGGLPLSLKVLGSFFRKREARVWESALNRLAKTPNMEIFETLKLSFDGLEASEKKIFLDIACFYKGHNVERVTRVLDSFGFDPVIGISALIEKSLITVSNERIHMHDVLQEMGMEIVRKCYPNSRLWQNEFHDFIKKNEKLGAIEAIVSTHVDEDMSDENTGFSADVFENMKNLRLLDICGGFTSCKPTTLPDELRWLRWDEYPFSSLSVANLQKLVGLIMIGGEIEHLLMGDKVMPYMKLIDLRDSFSFRRLPDFSWTPNVERLILSNCCNLVEVHESLGSLRRLVYLDMSGCDNLKCLPSRIEMESLETLSLSYCYSLEEFPEVSPCMVKLSNINLDGCENVKNIPNSICELKNLQTLHLYDCMKLRTLPEELGSMKKLEEIRLGFKDHVKGFERQPESINFHTLTNLCCLRILDLSWRQIEDEDFFNNLHACSFLEELYLSGNSKLVQLPASISRVSRLKRLELNDCRQLQSCQALPSGIQVLKAHNCKALKKIDDLTVEYMWLYKIWLTGCKELLENQENERCLSKMLQQSFLEKCAVIDRRLSISIPGSKIPSWFKEQRHGSAVAFKLPPNYHTRIMGFTVCGVLRGKWKSEYNPTSIFLSIENNGKLIPESEVDCINAFTENTSVQIVYIPVSFLEQHMDDEYGLGDGSLIVEGSRFITISIQCDQEVVRCGAHVVYKEDVEWIQQPETCISDCRNLDQVQRFGNTLVYKDEVSYMYE